MLFAQHLLNPLHVSFPFLRNYASLSELLKVVKETIF